MKYYIGQPIAYIEQSGGGSYGLYARVCWFDRIATIDGALVTTEAGVKLKVSNGDFSCNYGELVFRGRMPKHNMVNDMYGKEIPRNLGCVYNNEPLFKMYVRAFADYQECETYQKSRREKWQQDLNEYKEREAHYMTQAQRKAEVLKELTVLKAKNDVVRNQLAEEEYELEQRLIREHAKKIDYWPDEETGKTHLSATEW